MKHAFMIAATGSGCGKTTITCALLKALKNINLKPASYKCGPDYIDPMFHRAVLGIESKNLDLYFSDTEEVRRIFYEETNGDAAVVEGVMGLYDGVSPSTDIGSSYDLACRLDIPIVLVVDAQGMGRSLLALIRGFQAMDEERRIKAVILNRISPMYFETIGKQIEEELHLAVLGYFPKMENLHIESRYLGLKLPEEIETLEDDLQRAAEVIGKNIDVARLLSMTEADEKQVMARGRCEAEFSEETAAGKTVRIGVAKDEAFCFFYEENLALLRRLGAQLVEFSPLRDTKLPDGLNGLLLCGGYPELHASALADNVEMRRSVKEAIEAGMPSLAECGGFMYLHDAIRVDGEDYPMVGAVDGICEKKDRLVRFGYMSIKEKEPRFMKASAGSIKGHEFHYYDSSNNGTDGLSVKPSSGKSWEAGHIAKDHWWGFAHLYYPSDKAFAEAFVEKCRTYRKVNI